MVTIRLTRRGAKKQPFYHVVVTDSRVRQGGTTLEQVGYFNPVPAGKQRRLELNLERIDYWVGKGAKPSERVAELVKKLDLPEGSVVVVDEIEPNLERAARNIAGLRFCRAMGLNSYEALLAKRLVFTRPALEQMLKRLQGDAVSAAPAN